MIGIVIALSIYLILQVQTQGFKCISSPMTYAIANMRTSDSSPITCTCSTPTTKAVLIATKDNLTIQSYQNQTWLGIIPSK
jgi:6,7-dimethyl-8-ribityllumazine synthase